MKITQEEAVDHQTVLHIELEEDDLAPYLDRGYKRVGPRTLIPGFRKGKAPRRIVENFLGRESLLNEVLDSMAPEVADRAISEQELDAFGLPRLELLDLDPFTMKATVPLTPEVDLSHYKDIRKDEEPVEVTEEDAEQRLDQLRHTMASWEPVDRTVSMGDMVTIDALAKVDGASILDEKGAEFFLDEDGTKPFPGFSQHLVEVAKDESTEFTLTIPEDHADSDIAGKEAHFKATVSEIKERVLPELDDEFAKGVRNGFDSLDDLREEVRKELVEEAEAEATRQYREAVVQALIEGTSFELPLVTIEREIEHMEEDRATVLGRINVRMDDYLQSIGKTEEEMRDEMRERAVERVRRGFVISKVAELEALEVSDEEVQERVKDVGSETGVEKISTSAVRESLLAEKAVDRLVEIAKGEDLGGVETDDEPAIEPSDDEEELADEGGDAHGTKA